VSDRSAFTLIALVGLVALGMAGFVVLAAVDHASEGYGLLAAIPALVGVIIGVQIKSTGDQLGLTQLDAGNKLAAIQTQLDTTTEHVNALRNGELVAKITEGVQAGLAVHLQSGIVEEPFRPSPVPASVTAPSPFGPPR
jgi:hypothetical protein